MSTTLSTRNWFGATAMPAIRTYIKSREHLLFLVGAAVIAIHLLTQAFFDPEPMSNAGDNVLTGIAGPAIVLLIATGYSRLAIGFRAAAAFGLGLFAVIAGLIIHVPHMVAVETSVSDVTAIGADAVGLVFVGMAFWLAWKSLPRLVFKLALIPAVPVLLLFLVFPVALATFIVNTPRQPLGAESPADYGFAYESVQFENDDDNTLKGWYIPSENGAAVVLLHGAGKNRTTTLEYADIFADHGYGVLLFDRRGYGESEGSPNVFGWTGAEDVHAAVRYLEGREDVDLGRIGALGLSVGGEIVLQAIAENEGIAAVVSEGAGLRAWKEFEQQPGKGFGENVFGVSMYAAYSTIELISSDDQPPSNKDLIAGVGPRQVLLISTGSEEEGMWNRVLQEEGGPTVDLWETGGSHIDGLSEQPAEYERQVIGLFDEALLGN